MGWESRFYDLVLTVAGPILVLLLVMVARWTLHVRDSVRTIDKAINHRPAGEPNIYDLVKQGNDALTAHTKEDEFNFGDMRARLKEIKEGQA